MKLSKESQKFVMRTIKQADNFLMYVKISGVVYMMVLDNNNEANLIPVKGGLKKKRKWKN